MSERPRYCAAAGCSLLHFLAAAGTSFTPLGVFSVPVFSTYSAESGAGIKIRSQNFHVGHSLRLFCSAFFFHWRRPRTFFWATLFACAPILQCSLYFLQSRIPDFIPVSNFTACTVRHWHGSNCLIRALHPFFFIRVCKINHGSPLLLPGHTHALFPSVQLRIRAHFFTSSGVSAGLLPFRYPIRSFLGRLSCQCSVSHMSSFVNGPAVFGSGVDHISAVR